MKAKAIHCGGIHTAVLDINGGIWTFGCGSDGRLGHPESDNHTYLYKYSILDFIICLQEKGTQEKLNWKVFKESKQLIYPVVIIII